MFSRENRRPKTAKTKIYFTFGGCRGFRCGSLFVAVVVSTCAGFRGCRTCLNAGSGPLVVCSVLLSALLLCSRCVAYKYGSISRSKGVLECFPCWMYVCIACVLCVDCVALYACGVRRFYGLLRVCPCFSLFLYVCPAFILLPCVSVPALLCLSFCLVFPFLLCLCGSLGVLLGFLFPLRTIRKKKGRKGCPLRPLLSCVVGVFACRSYSVALDACFSVIIPRSSA